MKEMEGGKRLTVMIVIPRSVGTSSRLSEKQMLRAAGKFVLQHTYESAKAWVTA